MLRPPTLEPTAPPASTLHDDDWGVPSARGSMRFGVAHTHLVGPACSLADHTVVEANPIATDGGLQAVAVIAVCCSVLLALAVVFVLATGPVVLFAGALAVYVAIGAMVKKPARTTAAS